MRAPSIASSINRRCLLLSRVRLMLLLGFALLSLGLVGRLSFTSVASLPGVKDAKVDLDEKCRTKCHRLNNCSIVQIGDVRKKGVGDKCKFKQLIGNNNPFIKKPGQGIFAIPVSQAHFRKVKLNVATFITEHAQKTEEQWINATRPVLKANVNSDGILLMTVTSVSHKEMTMNFLAALERNSIKQFILWCLDEQIYKILLEHGYASKTILVHASWRNKGIMVLESKRRELDILSVLTNVLALGFRMFYNDLHVIPLSPAAFNVAIKIDDHGRNADLVFMVDRPVEGFDHVDSGFFCATPAFLPVLNRTSEILASDLNVESIQTALNRVLINEFSSYRFSNKFNDLSRLLFASEYYLVTKKFNELSEIYPFAVHMNDPHSTLSAKKLALKERNMWYIGSDFE